MFRRTLWKFLMYGTIFAAVRLIMDYMKGETLSDWWTTILIAYASAGTGALLLRKLNIEN